MSTENQQWGSRIGYILATIGMAFGLGAIWRFPYVAAESGGGAFILIFTFLTIVVAIPAGLAELAFARKMKNGPIVSFRKTYEHKGIIKYIGWIFPLIPLGMNMYYLVVVSWTMVYTLFTITNGTELMANPSVFFHDFESNKFAIFGATVIIVLTVSMICLKGIQAGIERFSKFCIPLHYVVLFLLLGTVLTIPGVEKGLELFAKPDMNALFDPSIWARAAGMALFAVGLGPACLMAYGSHLPDNSDITMDFFTVVMWNLFGCILSGLVVIPAVVAFGLDLQAGPGLTYITLPYIFAQLPFSGLVAFAFFFAMLLGGLSAGVGILENSVTTFSGGLGWSRQKTVCIIAVITILGSIPCIWSSTFLEKFDFLIGDIGYTLTASIMALTLAWYVGARKVRQEWLLPGSSIKLGRSFDIVYKYIVVPLLLFLFYQSLCNISKIFG
ncbi:sodium-dependent transporter [uncultured Megasphaera sp.]|uniref:sodium-dependent transporter n=1 Tax=uncultured Megasphaera sp. TaxID=165188 RepID=UPI00265AED4B|nr:sodium-dependent transporter [uncultured Megasphaera sp.]